MVSGDSFSIHIPLESEIDARLQVAQKQKERLELDTYKDPIYNSKGENIRYEDPDEYTIKMENITRYKPVPLSVRAEVSDLVTKDVTKIYMIATTKLRDPLESNCYDSNLESYFFEKELDCDNDDLEWEFDKTCSTEEELDSDSEDYESDVETDMSDNEEESRSQYNDIFDYKKTKPSKTVSFSETVRICFVPTEPFFEKLEQETRNNKQSSGKRPHMYLRTSTSINPSPAPEILKEESSQVTLEEFCLGWFDQLKILKPKQKV